MFDRKRAIIAKCLNPVDVSEVVKFGKNNNLVISVKGGVKQFNLAKNDKIIDIGGGDSFFVDHLLNLGYQDITVLDISEQAVERAKERLGDKAEKVKWIIADAANFHTSEKYDFWHDRAAFHFLTDEKEIVSYLDTLNKGVKPEGILVIGTFSVQGPENCSGINIKQYSEKSMTDQLKNFFNKLPRGRTPRY